MKIAITIWADRISPVFDTARIAIIVDIENGEFHNRQEVIFPEDLPQQKVARLRELGVKTLVCGAISRPFAELVSSAGIRLVPFVSGDVNEVLKAMLVHGDPPRTFSMPGCRCGQGRRFHGRRGNCGKRPRCPAQKNDSEKNIL